MNSIRKIHLLHLSFFISISFLIMAAKPDVLAQSGFAKAIPINADVDIDDIIFYQDQLILRGNIAIDSLGLWGILIAGLDTNGILNWKSVIYDTTLNSHLVVNTPSRLFISSDQRIILPTNYYSTNEFVVYYTDLYGKEIMHRFYPFEGFNIFPFDINQVFDDYYISGIVSANGYQDIFMLKVNKNGDMIWLKYYGTPNQYDNSIDVDKNEDETLAMYGHQFNRDFINSEAQEGWKKPLLITIDTSGSIISEWIGEENDSRTLGGEYFCRMENGDWIMQSTHYSNVNGPFGEEVKTSPTVTRLDSNFNQIWKVYLSNFEKRSYQIRDMDFDPNNGHIILTGGKHILAQNESEFVNWTIKLDTSGQILWNNIDTVYFSRQNTHNTAGLAIAPSGSIYVGGYVTVNELEPRSQAFIIKYTSDGCSDTLCTTTSISEQIKQADLPIVMYPNPVSDILHLLVSESTGTCQMQLSDMHGRIASVSQISPGSQDIALDLPAGVYIASFTNSTGIFYSRKLIVY